MFGVSLFCLFSGGRLLGPHVTVHRLILGVVGMDLLLDLGEGEVRHSRVFAVEDARDLLEGGALRLDVDKVDPDELEGVPELFGRYNVSSIYLQEGRNGTRKRTV